TWRNWKCNTLKKITKQKTHMMGTGGGSPAKNLHLTSIEHGLLDFLTPDAIGLTGISEGGFEDVVPNQLTLHPQPISPRMPNQNDLALHQHFGNKTFNSSEIEDDNNASEQDNQAIYAASSAKGLASTKYSEGMKKPKLMSTAMNLLERKSISENLKQKMLELKQEKLQLNIEKLAVDKGILQELQNLNNNILSMREEIGGQYLINS
ncbi:thermostable monoacylglycerol lipase, partial [Lasius niger]